MTGTLYVQLGPRCLVCGRWTEWRRVWIVAALAGSGRMASFEQRERICRPCHWWAADLGVTPRALVERL